MTRVCPFQLRELHGRIILWQEAPKVDITEERAHLPQGALSLAKKQKKHNGRIIRMKIDAQVIFSKGNKGNNK